MNTSCRAVGSDTGPFPITRSIVGRQLINATDSAPVYPLRSAARAPQPSPVFPYGAHSPRLVRCNVGVHTIGNLTLVTQPLNSTLSNAAWDEKRETLAEHSVLFLNKELQDEPQWTEETIRARSRQLAKLISEVWPGPDSPVWEADVNTSVV